MHRVIYTESFFADLAAHVAYLRSTRVSDRKIEQWHHKLLDRCDELARWPHANPVDERYTTRGGRLTRKMIYREHIVLYQLDPDHPVVSIIAFFHGATNTRR
jgi:plasmid stabilization system protein ParE